MESEDITMISSKMNISFLISRKLRPPKFVALLITLTACVPVAYGPKTEKKNPANYLSGEHYEGTALVGPVAFMKRKEVMTKISGRLFLDSGIESIALKHQRLRLLGVDEKIVGVTRSDLNGHFEFAGEIADGSYVIQLESENYSAVQAVEIKGYKVADLMVMAKPKNK